MGRATVMAAMLAALGTSVIGSGPADAADRSSLVDRIVAKADPSLMEVLVTTRTSATARPRFDTIKVPDVAAAKRVVGDMLGKPDVVAVEMNRRVFADSWNDPYYSQQWGLHSKLLNMGQIAYLTRHDTARPKVAVVDSGVNGTHADLAGHVIGGYNAFTGSNVTGDDCGHGTHVAGIVGAVINNGRGVVGMEPRAYIVPVKVLRWQSGLLGGGDCSGDSSSVSQGIMWAAGHAHVINLSLGASSPSPAEQEAVSYARRLGRVVVAAAGNTGDSQMSYPAGYSGVIGVAAAAPTGSSPYWQRASYSTVNASVDVTAPGSSVLSTVPPNAPACPSGSQWPSSGAGYCFMSGTSMATPHVSAEAALAMQHCGWSGGTVFSKVQTTASQYPAKNTAVGFGLINPVKLLSCR